MRYGPGTGAYLVPTRPAAEPGTEVYISNTSRTGTTRGTYPVGHRGNGQMDIKMRYGHWGAVSSLYVIVCGSRCGGARPRGGSAEKPGQQVGRQEMKRATYATSRVIDATKPKPARERVLVVNSKGMTADVFYKHVRTRHHELDDEHSVVDLRVFHAQTHELVPSILDHVHEGEPHDPELDPDAEYAE